MHILPATDQVTIRHEGSRILMLRNGAVILDMPWGAALEVGSALIAKARQAEEIEAAERIIRDQAIIERAVFPVGLSSHPKIQAEALKEAQWGDIRRYLPSPGIHSGEAVGTPTLDQATPTAEQQRRNDQWLTDNSQK